MLELAPRGTVPWTDTGLGLATYGDIGLQTLEYVGGGPPSSKSEYHTDVVVDGADGLGRRGSRLELLASHFRRDERMATQSRTDNSWPANNPNCK